ncbi:MAG TPA: HD domain-containing phosphohydrolase, partial [Bacilli bacterium]|nr:HD domain-containing phosphohydrolase [Bacilli bacterium]
LFDDFLLKLKELIVPTVISMLVIPYLTKYESTNLLSAIGFLGVFLVVVIVISHEYAKESSYRRNMTREIVKLLEQKIMTGQIGHGNRVGAICELLLEKVNYPKKQRNNLIQLAIIHDIGKVVLPLHVFNRRGALTLSEEQAYQSHCEKGAKLIASIYQDERFAKWIHDHHERWDGKGFPNRKQGEAIPFEARILGLANHLDHLFMRQRDLQTVDQLLHGVSGTILDPSLVQLIDLELLTEIKEIYDDNSVALEVRPKEEIVASSEAANEASSFLGHLIYGSYSKGRLQWVTDTEAPTDKVTFLAEKALQSGRSFHELIEQEGKTFDMHFQVQHDHVSVIGNDVTSLIEFRSRLNRKILDSYRDVIKTVTQEKVLVCLQEREISEQLGGFVGSIQVQKATDVAATRKFVSKCMAPYVSGSDLIRIQLAVSEGATNLLKHAQDGVVSVFQQVGSVQVLFADQGSGIPLHELPKTVLVSGYSSKLSLGKGFSIMTKSAERMVIHTCSKGTQILLEFGTGETAESGKEG